MAYLFPKAIRRYWPALIFVSVTIGVAACSGPSWVTPVTPTGASQTKSVAQPEATKTPIAWVSWYTVNDSGLPGSNNSITGIQDGNGVVGVNYGNSSGSVQSFDASPAPGGYGNFQTRSFSQTSVTYLWGRADSSRGGEVGYIVPKDGSYSCNPCGATHGNSWQAINNPAAGNCNNTTLRGIDASWITVGYYLAGSSCGTAAPFEEYTESTCCSLGNPTTVFTPFSPPGPYDSAIATGVNGVGDAVGYSTSSGASTGWFYTYFAYSKIAVPNATSTQPLGINWQDDVVGEYWTSSGGPYGFLVQNPGGIQYYQYPIYFNNDAKYSQTIPYSVNDCGNISGTYLDGTTGAYNGFVATSPANHCSLGGYSSPRRTARKRAVTETH